jgi:hypothetical protein
MAINFPSSPIDDQTYTENNTSWYYDSSVGAWLALPPTDLVITGTLTVNAISSNGTTGANGQVLTSTGSGVYWANAASSGITTGKAIAMAIVFG